jgi:gliding motility-associated lipoprotein GldH
MNNILKNILCFCVIALFALSCGKEKVIFEKKYDLKNGQWAYMDTLDFTFTIADTMSLYDIVMVIKHTPQYATQNLYMNISTKFPTGERPKQLLNIDMADNTGKWEGNCNSSECTFQIAIQPNAYFNAAGQYTITLEQYMRDEYLKDIKSIGVKLVGKNQKRDFEVEKQMKQKRK